MALQFTNHQTSVVRQHFRTGKVVNITNNGFEQRLGGLMHIGSNALLQTFNAKLTVSLILHLNNTVSEKEEKKPKGEVPKKRDKSSPTPGPRVGGSSAGTRGSTSAPGQRGSLQIGIGPAGVRIPIGAGTRRPTPTPTPRPNIPSGVGRGLYHKPDRP